LTNQQSKKNQALSTESEEIRKSKHTHTHLDHSCSADALCFYVGTANIDAAHHSVCTDEDAAPISPGPGYYMKPQRTQMYEHL